MRYGETAAAKDQDEMISSRGAGEDELMEEYGHPSGVAGENGMRLTEIPAPCHFSGGVGG
jgi:hypothetical protein